jgi:hypothetical protein
VSTGRHLEQAHFIPAIFNQEIYMSSSLYTPKDFQFRHNLKFDFSDSKKKYETPIGGNTSRHRFKIVKHLPNNRFLIHFNDSESSQLYVREISKNGLIYGHELYHPDIKYFYDIGSIGEGPTKRSRKPYFITRDKTPIQTAKFFFWLVMLSNFVKSKGTYIYDPWLTFVGYWDWISEKYPDYEKKRSDGKKQYYRFSFPDGSKLITPKTLIAEPYTVERKGV